MLLYVARDRETLKETMHGSTVEKSMTKWKLNFSNHVASPWKDFLLYSCQPNPPPQISSHFFFQWAINLFLLSREAIRYVNLSYWHIIFQIPKQFHTPYFLCPQLWKSPASVGMRILLAWRDGMDSHPIAPVLSVSISGKNATKT